MRIARFLLVGVAIVACAWFALAVRQAHDLSGATAIVKETGRLTTTQSAKAAALLRAAGTLNPDSEVLLERARLAQRIGDSRDAERIARQVVRDEPMNLLAWYTLAQLAGLDSRTLFHALGEIRALEPPPPTG